MDYLSDILLIFAALTAAAFCAVLSIRLRRFASLEKGVGGAVATLSAQVEELQRAVAESRVAGEAALISLGRERRRAEEASRRIEMLLASLHDLPEADEETAA